MTYGYARVSSNDQNLSRQINAFNDFGIQKKYIYCDKKSGKDFDRTNYKKMIRKLKFGDLLVIKSIDRLGRNYEMIIEEWARITRSIHADILVLDMPLLDTRSKGNSLLGKFISDIVLQVLSFVAENERTNIKLRQREGIELAKKRGVKFGRPAKKLSKEFIMTAKKYLNGEISLKEASIKMHMNPSTFYYHAIKLDSIKKAK